MFEQLDIILSPSIYNVGVAIIGIVPRTLIPVIIMLAVLAASTPISAGQEEILVTRYILLAVVAEGINTTGLPFSLDTNINGIQMHIEAVSGSNQYPVVLRIVAGPARCMAPLSYHLSTLEGAEASGLSLDIDGLRLAGIIEKALTAIQGKDIVWDISGFKVLSDYYVLNVDSRVITLTPSGLGKSAGTETIYTMVTATIVTTPLASTTRIEATSTIPTASMPLSTTSMPTVTQAATPTGTTVSVTRGASASTTSIGMIEKMVSIAVSGGIGLILAVLAYLLVKQLF